MVDVNALSAAQDTVFADHSVWPTDVDGDEITYCNIASLHVANLVGCHDFDPSKGREPLRADEIYSLFRNSRVFNPRPMRICQDLVNNGALIFAILPSWELHQHAGHICTLTPGVGDFSGRWNSHTPMCMNLGRAGTCFRRRGVNWAFQMIPEFYVWGNPP